MRMQKGICRILLEQLRLKNKNKNKGKEPCFARRACIQKELKARRKKSGNAKREAGPHFVARMWVPSLKIRIPKHCPWEVKISRHLFWSTGQWSVLQNKCLDIFSLRDFCSKYFTRQNNSKNLVNTNTPSVRWPSRGLHGYIKLWSYSWAFSPQSQILCT